MKKDIFFSKKIIVLAILILILLPTVICQASEEDIQKGVELYWQATQFMERSLFAEAKTKYEEAAQYLSGEIQRQSLQMAEFVGRMNKKISGKSLFKDFKRSDSSSFGRIEAIGKVKEEGKVWHLYKTQYTNTTFLHLAIEGKKYLDDVVNMSEPGLFKKVRVIGDREGYISQELTHIPQATSRIRMWYCDQDDTTNIVYENYSFDKASKDTQIMANGASSEIFAKIKCSKPFPIPLPVIGVAAFFILVGIIVWRFKLLKLVPKKVWVIIFYIFSSIIAVLLVLFLFSLRR